ncbi:MAG: HlyD family efflux transporter periplasmic adaptor subunit [Bacteroidota bacterium]
MRINPVYVVMVIGLLVIVPFTRQLQEQPTEFYGIAQDPDIDVAVDFAGLLLRFTVQEGEAVQAGQTLAYLERNELPYAQASLGTERQRLEAERREQSAERQAQIQELQQKRELALFEVDNKLREVTAEQARQRTLTEQLLENAIAIPDQFSAELAALQAERAEVTKLYDLQIRTLRQNAQTARAALDARLAQMGVEATELERQRNAQAIKSPAAGVVGSLNIVPGEQVSARQAILSIYQAQPNEVTTYLPEGQRVAIQLGDTLVVRSIQKKDYQVIGTVTGLGSKIRELPVRMRRDPTVQAWGREVRVQLPLPNELLQGERVLVVKE